VRDDRSVSVKLKSVLSVKMKPKREIATRLAPVQFRPMCCG